jgi:hypothetical protein
VWITGPDAADLLVLRKQSVRGEPLTGRTTAQAAQKLKALAKGNTAHSIKGGAVAHAVSRIYQNKLDPPIAIHFMEHTRTAKKPAGGGAGGGRGVASLYEGESGPRQRRASGDAG